MKKKVEKGQRFERIVDILNYFGCRTRSGQPFHGYMRGCYPLQGIEDAMMHLLFPHVRREGNDYTNSFVGDGQEMIEYSAVSDGGPANQFWKGIDEYLKNGGRVYRAVFANFDGDSAEDPGYKFMGVYEVKMTYKKERSTYVLNHERVSPKFSFDVSKEMQVSDCLS